MLRSIRRVNPLPVLVVALMAVSWLVWSRVAHDYAQYQRAIQRNGLRQQAPTFALSLSSYAVEGRPVLQSLPADARAYVVFPVRKNTETTDTQFWETVAERGARPGVLFLGVCVHHGCISALPPAGTRSVLILSHVPYFFARVLRPAIRDGRFLVVDRSLSVVDTPLVAAQGDVLDSIQRALERAQ